MTFVALQSYRPVLKWDYHWRTAGLRGICSESLQKAKFLWPVCGKCLAWALPVGWGTMGAVVLYLSAGCTWGSWSSFACADGWENIKINCMERLMSSPRQSDTVWLLRVCSVAWADVIAPSCWGRRIQPPTFLLSMFPPSSPNLPWIWPCVKLVCALTWQRTPFVPGWFSTLNKLLWSIALSDKCQGCYKRRCGCRATTPLWQWWTIRGELMELHAKALLLWYWVLLFDDPVPSLYFMLVPAIVWVMCWNMLAPNLPWNRGLQVW